MKLNEKMAKEIAKNKLKIPGLSYSSFFSSRLAFIIAVILLLTSIGFLYAKNQEIDRLIGKQAPTIQPTTQLIPTLCQIPTLSPTPTLASALIKPKKTNTPSIDPDTPIVDGKTTWTYVAPGEKMSTSEELFEAMNNYRKAHGLSILQKNGTLCSIAQARANELQQLDKLDSHAGMKKYADSQKEFNHLSEVISGGVYPESGVHIVEWGFDRSLTGHKEAISNPVWQYGCGGIAGWFAVFIFGER